jgi:hypothetical protein
MAQDYSKASGSALQASGAIPEKWSTKVRNKGYPGTVLSSISNTDYSKEIKRKKKKFK